jgi:hypothetical protein
MPSMMDFPLNDAMRRALAAPEGAEQSLNNLYETLSQDYLYPNPGNLVLFEGNHDLSRIYSELNGDFGPVPHGDGLRRDGAAHPAVLHRQRDPDDQHHQGSATTPPTAATSPAAGAATP